MYKQEPDEKAYLLYISKLKEQTLLAFLPQHGMGLKAQHEIRAWGVKISKCLHFGSLKVHISVGKIIYTQHEKPLENLYALSLDRLEKAVTTQHIFQSFSFP